ncbi:MAG: succinylglutamate desuccinylase/aspartoacylase family protein [Haloferacaceae archaeon]
MRTYQLGEKEPEIAVVGAVHGDEPCGARAIERVVDAAPAVDRPVKFVVANEEALDRDVRYVDADLNRAFENEGGEGHEHRLARRLADAVAGCVTLSIHSTQSYAEPFAMVSGLGGEASAIAASLPVVALLDVGSDDEGRLFAIEATDLIEVEAGLQGSDEAARNAEEVVEAFLRATGALPEPPEPRRLPTFRLGEAIPKPGAERHEVFVENFTHVGAGEAFAGADDRRLVADESFYPVLLSANGYADIFGYTADRVGTFDPATDEVVAEGVAAAGVDGGDPATADGDD